MTDSTPPSDEEDPRREPDDSPSEGAVAHAVRSVTEEVRDIAHSLESAAHAVRATVESVKQSVVEVAHAVDGSSPHPGPVRALVDSAARILPASPFVRILAPDTLRDARHAADELDRWMGYSVPEEPDPEPVLDPPTEPAAPTPSPSPSAPAESEGPAEQPEERRAEGPLASFRSAAWHAIGHEPESNVETDPGASEPTAPARDPGEWSNRPSHLGAAELPSSTSADEASMATLPSHPTELAIPAEPPLPQAVDAPPPVVGWTPVGPSTTEETGSATTNATPQIEAPSLAEPVVGRDGSEVRSVEPQILAPEGAMEAPPVSEPVAIENAYVMPEDDSLVDPGAATESTTDAVAPYAAPAAREAGRFEAREIPDSVLGADSGSDAYVQPTSHDGDTSGRSEWDFPPGSEDVVAPDDSGTDSYSDSSAVRLGAPSESTEDNAYVEPVPSASVMEPHEEVADRLDRYADRYDNAGQDDHAELARSAADSARASGDGGFASDIESDFHDQYVTPVPDTPASAYAASPDDAGNGVVLSNDAGGSDAADSSFVADDYSVDS